MGAWTAVVNLEQALEQVKSWALEVGAMQLEYHGRRDLAIETKSSSYDLVTEIDKRSEVLLIEKIAATYPEHTVLGEEGGEVDRQSEYRWVIDPIDGTTNYAHGYPIFAISIALQHHGESVLGVVYFPALNQLYRAIKGKGAFLNSNRLTVSTTDSLAGAMLATGFPYDKATSPENNLDYFHWLVPKISGIRRSGSAAFDLCNVAAGRLDGYWELKIKPWDIAAAGLVLEEAGGKIIYLEEHTPISVVTGNPAVCALILNELQAAAAAKRQGGNKP